MLAGRFLGEGRGGVDRHDGRAGGRVGVLAGVDRAGREAVIGLVGGHEAFAPSMRSCLAIGSVAATRAWFQYWIRSIRVMMSTTGPPSIASTPELPGQQQAIGLVEVDADVELRQRPGHDSPTLHRSRVEARRAATRASVTSWMLPTDWPSRSTGQLRDAAGLHQLDGLGGRGLRARRSRASRGPRACSRSPTVCGGGSPPMQVVLGQPGVVEELAQVIAAGVGAEGDDDVVGRQPPGVAQRGGHGRARRAADQDPLAPRQRPGRVEALGVADRGSTRRRPGR